jgi:hypothetical protein
MEPLYFVTEWDCCKGETQRQGIKQFNMDTQHLPLAGRAFFRPHFGVPNASQQENRVWIGISRAVKILYRILSSNRIAAFC